jgi:separase
MSPLLQSLPKQWTHSTVAPREAEVTDLLNSQSLFLYFGHGSGIQYVRNRSVRRLPQCPTTWLMGCSSSAVTDHGTFEPSGMVLSYMAAGAPAVVGTLWDVTDKDCDRASVKSGEAWGLWEAGEAYKLLAVKGKKNKVETEQARGARAPAKSVAAAQKRAANTKMSTTTERVSLVQAVRMGREECYLRYLNGAALVVYGIPVFLDD